MIPARILQIAKTVVVACAVMTLCFYAVSSVLAIYFGITSAWMLVNLLVLALVLRIALGTEEHKPLGLFMAAGVFKLLWLFGGVYAIQRFGVGSGYQVLGVVLGIGSVLFVVIMKALGYRMSQSLVAEPAEGEKKKVAEF